MNKGLELHVYRFCIEDRYGGWTDQIKYKNVIAYSEEMARSSLRKICSRDIWKIRWTEDNGPVYNGLVIKD